MSSATDNPRGGADDGDKKGKHNFVRATQDWLHSAFFDNAALKFVAFILALTVFFLVRSDKDAVYSFSVGVSYTLPESRVLTSEPPDTIRLTVRGSRRIIKRLDERDFERPEIDLRKAPNGEYVLQNDMVRLPAGLELVSINPASFQVRLETLVERSLPILVQTGGKTPRGYKISSVVVTPAEAVISGAESIVSSVKQVRTRSVSLDDRTETFTEMVSLVKPDQYVTLADAQPVQITIRVEEELSPRRLPPIPITMEPRAGLTAETVKRLMVTPTEVTVILRGPTLAIEAIAADKVQAAIEANAADLLPGAKRQAPVVLRGLPDGVAGEISPAEVTITLR